MNEYGGIIPTANAPIPTSADSIYAGDVDVANSDMGGFSGSVTDLFDDLHTVVTDASATNPKTIKIWFQHTIQLFSCGFGCDDPAGNFSNIKVKLFGSNETIRSFIDESTDDTKYNSRTFDFNPAKANGVIIEFHTDDPVCLSNFVAWKSYNTNSHMLAVDTITGHVDNIHSRDGSLNVNEQNDGLAIAQGLVVGKRALHKFGTTPSIGFATGFEAIWNGGAYTGHAPTAADTMTVVSTDAADTGAVVSSGLATGGTSLTIEDTGATFSTDGVVVGDVVINVTQEDHGIITAVAETELTVIYMKEGTVPVADDDYIVATSTGTGAAVLQMTEALDGNWDDTCGYVVLNGTTPVLNTNQYLRCSRSEVVLAGTGGGNAGELSGYQTGTPANIFFNMPIGYNQTMIAAWSVPRGKTAYFTSWFASMAVKQSGYSIVRLLVSSFGTPFRVAEEISINTDGASYTQRTYEVAKNDLCEFTDVKIIADSSVNGLGVSAGFDLVVVDNVILHPEIPQ